ILVAQLNDLGLYEDSLAQLQRLAKLEGQQGSKQTTKALARRRWESNRPVEVVQLTDDLNLEDPNVDIEMVALRAVSLRQLERKADADAVRASLAKRTTDPLAVAREAVHRAPLSPPAVLNLTKVWFTNLELGKAGGEEDLLKLVQQVQQQLPDEEFTLPIQVSLLCKTGRKEQGASALKTALAR